MSYGWIALKSLTLTLLNIVFSLSFCKIFISKKIFTIYTKKGQEIVPKINLNKCEYTKQELSKYKYKNMSEKKALKDTVSDGELLTAKYVSAVYVYILYTQLSGRLRCHFRVVEPEGWNGIDR
jgi:hypothetical protein